MRASAGRTVGIVCVWLISSNSPGASWLKAWIILIPRCFQPACYWYLTRDFCFQHFHWFFSMEIDQKENHGRKTRLICQTKIQYQHGKGCQKDENYEIKDKTRKESLIARWSTRNDNLAFVKARSSPLARHPEYPTIKTRAQREDCRLPNHSL